MQVTKSPPRRHSSDCLRKVPDDCGTFGASFPAEDEDDADFDEADPLEVENDQ
jgi:hypothetical protein